MDEGRPPHRNLRAHTRSREAHARTLCTAAPRTRRAHASNHGRDSPRHARRTTAQNPTLSPAPRAAHAHAATVAGDTYAAKSRHTAWKRGYHRHNKRDAARSSTRWPQGERKARHAPLGRHASGTRRGPGGKSPPHWSPHSRAMQCCRTPPRGTSPTTTRSARSARRCESKPPFRSLPRICPGGGEATEHRADSTTSARRRGGVRTPARQPPPAIGSPRRLPWGRPKAPPARAPKTAELFFSFPPPATCPMWWRLLVPTTRRAGGRLATLI